MNYRIITIIAFLISSTCIKAQSVLSFEEALAYTLSHNYNILMGEVNEDIAKNNASKANNGFLPIISATGGYNWSYLEGENELRTETRSFAPNNSYNYNAGASISYSLFNGLGRRYAYLQAKENEKISKLQLQQTIQNTIVELAQVYYEIARLEESVNLLQQSLDVSKQRYQRTQYAYEYGQAKNLDLLNAKVDVNTDSIALVSNIQQLENSKRNLNLIMGRAITEDVTVSKKIEVPQIYNQEMVVETATANNVNLQIARNNIQLGRYGISASKSNILPSISANAGYIYRGTDDPNGAFLIGSSIYGPQAGISMTWNLFNGQNNTQRKNAKLGLKISELQKENIEQTIQSQAMNSYANYENLLFILKAQEDNLVTAEDNFTRSEESYKQGKLTNIEFRQAQLNLLNAQQALNKAKYDAKNAEFQVLAIMGTLVK